jgi:hypothetical protein
MNDPNKPRELMRGERIYLKFGANRYGVVTADERDYYVKYALDTDDPKEPHYGCRIARRGEVSPIREPAALATSIGDFLKGRE